MARRHNDLSVTLPPESTWRTALRAVDKALGVVDEPMLIWPQGVENRHRLRQLALEEAQRMNSPSESTSPVTRSPGRPIRSEVDLKSVERPPPLSQRARCSLREAAKEAAKQDF